MFLQLINQIGTVQLTEFNQSVIVWQEVSVRVLGNYFLVLL